MAFVALLTRHRSELVRYHMQLPLRSPARAAIATLLDQQAEIAAIVTGERNYFAGKAHSDSGGLSTPRSDKPPA